MNESFASILMGSERLEAINSDEPRYGNLDTANARFLTEIRALFRKVNEDLNEVISKLDELYDNVTEA